MTRSIVRTASYGSVTVYSFDLELARERLRAAARELRAVRPDVERVLLFGSVARGDAVPGSDADVAVLLRDDSPLALARPMDRALEITQFEGLGLGVDLVVLTRAEAEGSALWETVQREGIELGTS